MHNMKFWYRSSADSFTSALPVGNGSLGGMIYGGVPEERISLNLDTLWSGGPKQTEYAVSAETIAQVRELIFAGNTYEAEQLIESKMLGNSWNESYQPLGNLRYIYNNVDTILDYHRELDLQTATAKTQFRTPDQKISSEVFCSYPDNILSIKITSDTAKSLDISIYLGSLLQHTVESNANEIVMCGNAPSHVLPNYVESHSPIVYNESNPGMAFQARASILSSGTIVAENGSIRVMDTDALHIILCAADGFRGFDNPTETRAEALDPICRSLLQQAEKKTYEILKRDHIQDYTHLFDRVTLKLGDESKESIPTDLRLENIKKGEQDHGMVELLFHYGRYLLIASSRKGSQPANLQGIWNEEMRPAWSSNWTTNINTEMNYWHSGVCNLLDCNEPLVRMLEELSIAGQKTARTGYHCRGWVANHNVDLWRHTTPVNGLAKYAYWPMGGVWLCSNLYEHYRFTKDLDFLRQTALPIIKQAAQFCLDWLCKGPDGKLHTCPSTSPENTYYDKSKRVCSVTCTSAMDLALIHELFANVLEAYNDLSLDDPIIEEIKNALGQLPDFKVGQYGQLQEWQEDYEEQDAGHRHFSVVYGLHPANIINRYENPQLALACENLINRRLAHGSGSFGWSCAWVISLYARLGKAKKSYEFVQNLIKKSVYNNLFDLHPPLGEHEREQEVFQIDGNFGATAGIAEMLLQSHLGMMELLPALPQAWPKGHITGLLTRNNCEVDLHWENHQLFQAIVRCKQTGMLRIKYKNRLQVYLKNRPIACKYENGVLYFESQAGETYSLKPL